MQIFGVISLVKRQNDTYTTVKRLKTMKNEMTYLLFGCVQCLDYLVCWHDKDERKKKRKEKKRMKDRLNERSKERNHSKDGRRKKGRNANKIKD